MRLDTLKARIAGADYVVDPYAVAAAVLRSPDPRLAFRRSADAMLVTDETLRLAPRAQDDTGRPGAHRPDAGDAGKA
jgi:hypothetical protein